MSTLTFKSAQFDNRRRLLLLRYSNGKKIELHYSHLSITDSIAEVWIDRETRGRSLGIRLQTQETLFLPYDQPLVMAKDPSTLLQIHIERTIAHLKESIRQKRVSKRYLAQQLHTSENQIQRLLNPRILNKNLEQLYAMATLLGLECEIRLKEAA